MTTSLDHSVINLLFQPPPPPPVCCCCFVLFSVLFVYLCCHFGLVCFVASDVLTTICHLVIVNVCVIIFLSIGNTQISILLLCFLYLFVDLMITMNEYNLFKPKYYLCLSLFDENRKQTNTKNKTERKSKTGKKRVCLCVKVWCGEYSAYTCIHLC